MSDSPSLRSRMAELAAAADRAAYEDVMHCNRCGFCTSQCPTYLATGDETLSPRGRNQALRAVLEGRLTDPALAARSFDTCLLCGICTSVCFAGVPTAALMSSAREKVMERHGEPWLLRLFLRGILPRPFFFEGSLRILFQAKRWGLTGWLGRRGILRRIHPRLAAAEAMIDEAPTTFLRSELAPAPPDAEVVQFLACGTNLLEPSAGRATARLLEGSGARHGSAGNVCCGLPGQSFGDRTAARRLARKNIELLEKFPRAVVLVDDSSCAATVKDYPSLFEPGDPWRARAAAVSGRTRDMVQWLADHPELAAAGKPTPRVVAYHDPCKARQAQGLVSEPRRALAAAPGVTVREIPEADQCCGGGGTYSFMQEDLSQAVGARKIQNILSTGAQWVVTSAVSCLLQVRAGLRRAQSPIRTQHISEFLSPEVPHDI